MNLATTVIVVAAGSSQRMGFDKLTAPLCGQSVLERSIRTICAVPEVEDLIVVTDMPERGEIARQAATKPLQIVPGGSQRHESVASGLAAANALTPLVAVHDAARPLVQISAFSCCLRKAATHGAAALAHRVVETLKRADHSGLVTSDIDRSDLWAMETPQCFRLPLLREAYEKIAADRIAVTDEVSAVRHIGHRVWLVENKTLNLKITIPSDLDLAAAILR